MNWVKQALLAFAFIVGFAGSLSVAHAQRAMEARTALVIGNADYSYSRLTNPLNDALDMASVLRAAGFEVILRTDADQNAMREGILTFGRAIKERRGVGLLFFAGHGVQANGENYILPVGSAFTSGADLKARAVTAAEAVDAMTAANNSLNIVILDACRNNSLPGSVGITRGLSRMDAGASLFVSFSTSPGELALDGSGRNSSYAKHLTQAIATPNISIENTFKRTLKGVCQETAGQQQPWMSSSFFGDFTFRPEGNPLLTQAPAALQPRAGLVSPQRAAPGSGPPLCLSGFYHVDGSNPDDSRYAGMASLTPAVDQDLFTWWIARQVFSGIGEFAGRMMVVNWGSKHPVIYTVEPDKNLDGEWADGTVTDRLTLFAQATSGVVPAPTGNYSAVGRSPNGTTYEDRVVITRLGNRYRFDWRVGSSTYYGTGMLDGNVMVVEWGAGAPIVYALAADGSMKGLWSNGRGEETLMLAR
ncbi:MAG: hypothetical protein EXQ83_05625 [Xanthobacteraceae bacterium]|nr:hypothetical protein [Xanthobacteraceae bacterium]